MIARCKHKHCKAFVRAYRDVRATEVYITGGEVLDTDKEIILAELKTETEVHNEDWWTQCIGPEHHMDNGWNVGFNELGAVCLTPEEDTNDVDQAE